MQNILNNCPGFFYTFRASKIFSAWAYSKREILASQGKSVSLFSSLFFFNWKKYFFLTVINSRKFDFQVRKGKEVWSLLLEKWHISSPCFKMHPCPIYKQPVLWRHLLSDFMDVGNTMLSEAHRKPCNKYKSEKLWWNLWSYINLHRLKIVLNCSQTNKGMQFPICLHQGRCFTSLPAPFALMRCSQQSVNGTI